jgi:hypothetical protein
MAGAAGGGAAGQTVDYLIANDLFSAVHFIVIALAGGLAGGMASAILRSA